MPSTIVIAATHSGAGKTTITTGILRALYNRKMAVQPFKCGPDYIDPSFHSFVSKNSSRNLDLFLMGEECLKQVFYRHAINSEIAVVEGVMGLYDGLGTKKDNGSTAHVSKIISSPVILVIDGKGMSSSAAALVMGYKNYDLDVNIAGIIINNMHGQKHYSLLKEVIERDSGIPCIGYLNKNNSISLESRHLGLVQAEEVDELDKKVDELAQMVEQTIDIDALIDIAKRGSKFEKSEVNLTRNKSQLIKHDKISIAVAKDKAFSFYYDDGLDTLVELGAKIIYFSPIYDRLLPSNIDGLYIGGGFPEIFATELEKNMSMKKSIKACIESRLPTYAECGGLMYLSRSIETLDQKTYKMCGVFDFGAHMTKRLQRFGYVNVDVNSQAFVDRQYKIKAHEFHRSMITGDENEICSYDVTRAREGSQYMNWNCGYSYKNCLAGYAHIHFTGSIDFARSFIRACEKYNQESDK